MNLSLTLGAVARIHPDRPAITGDGAHADLCATSRTRSHDCRCAAQAPWPEAPGDRVGIWMENCLELLPVLFGIWRAGLVAVPINNKLHPKELAWILDNSGAKLCLVTPELADKLAELPAGTPLPPIVVTGIRRPSSALLAGEPVQAAPTRARRRGLAVLHQRHDGPPEGRRADATATCCSPATATTPTSTFSARATRSCTQRRCRTAPASMASRSSPKGGHNVIVPGSFEPERIFAALARYPNVSMFAAPTMVSRLINHPLAGATDTRNLKTITYGGAPMYVSDLKRALELFGPRLYQLYGQGESPMTITGLSTRRCMPTAASRYRGAARQRRRRRAPACAVQDRRRGRPRAAARRDRRDRHAQRLRHAGLLEQPGGQRQGRCATAGCGPAISAAMDADGFLTIKDRSKDMIISGGSNIYPREIEEVLLTHAGVLEMRRRLAARTPTGARR